MEYWDSDWFGPKETCDNYFRDVLLAKRTNPLVLILEEVDNIFPYDYIAKEFFKLLRAWLDLLSLLNPRQFLLDGSRQDRTGSPILGDFKRYTLS
jgi:hypothetical protein